MQACKHLNASAAIPRWTNWFCRTTCRPLSENLAHCCKRSTRHQRESRNAFWKHFLWRWFKVLSVLNHLKFSLSHEYRNGLQHVEVIATFPRIIAFFFVFFFYYQNSMFCSPGDNRSSRMRTRANNGP